MRRRRWSAELGATYHGDRNPRLLAHRLGNRQYVRNPHTARWRDSHRPCYLVVTGTEEGLGENLVEETGGIRGWVSVSRSMCRRRFYCHNLYTAAALYIDDISHGYDELARAVLNYLNF